MIVPGSGTEGAEKMDRDYVTSLISCKKTVKSAPKKSMVPDPRNDYTLRNDFTCVSSDGTVFEVFMRKNTQLPFLFSIGLLFRSEHGRFTLCRYNGKHLHKNKIADRNQLDDFHIHKIFDQQLSDGTDSSLDAEATTRYATFEEALCAFLQDCNISGWEKYFPDLAESMNQLRIEGV